MIYSGSKYGSIQSQVSGPGHLVETNHNLPSSMVTKFHERMEEINPELVRVANQTPLDRFASFNPEAQILNDSLGMGGHGEPSIYGRRPYLPEFEDITRQDYPVPRALANRYFRMFYKLDPVVANGIELYGDSTFSDFELIGEGVKGEIKQMLDHMVDRVGLYNILTSMVRELLITGDAIPHCHFDEILGTWSFVAMHNPDQIEAIYTPFADMEPILHFIPDDKLIAILSSNHHATARLRASMPQELASKILMKQPIELSPVNCTLISRKLHPYEARGTSIMSRLWRIFALEDAIFNATIQTARRAAAPLRVAQIGDPQSGIAGTPQQEADLKRNLSIAERDPAAWLVLNSTVKFDTIGISDRVMSIDRHWDTIERIKLIALGISKGFLVGETTYACFAYNTCVTTPFGESFVQDLKPGDEVLDKHGMPKKVINSWNEGTPDSVTKIEVQGGMTFKATHNHRWPVWKWVDKCIHCGNDIKKAGRLFCSNKCKSEYGKVEYEVIDQSKWNSRKIPKGYEPVQKVRSDEINVGDYLMVPRTFDELQTNIEPERARLLGYYVAEGSLFKDNNSEVNKQACFSLHTNELSTLGEDIKSCFNVVNSDITAWEFLREDKSNNLEIRTAGKHAFDFANWLKENAGSGSKTKKLSSDVMRWPLHLKEELIKGAFRGDGSQSLSTSKYKGKVLGPYLNVRYTTASQELAKQLWMILVQLGYYGGITHNIRKDTRPGWPSETENWEICFASDTACKLADLVWGEDSLSSQVNRDRDVRDAVRMEDDYCYVPVKKISKKENDLPVYNIEVEDTHSYLVDGFATYNSTQGSLTVWMQRLSSLRRMIEKTWLYPKFFLPVAIVNQWVKPKEAEISGNKSAAIRVRRGHRELLEDGRYIIPHVKWQRQLDPMVDEDRINAITALMQMGSRVSESAKFTAAGMDFEKDLKQQAQDIKLQEKILGTTPLPPPGEEGGMDPGMGPPPTADPGAFEDFAPPTDPPGGMADDMMPPGGAPGSEGGEGFVSHKKAFKEHEVKDLEEIMLSGKNYSQEDSIWDELIDEEFSTAVIMDDRDGMWNRVQAHLYRKGYNENEINGLKDTLVAKKIIPRSANRLAKLEYRLDKEASSEDSKFLSGDTSRLQDEPRLSAGTIYEIEQTFGLKRD